MAHEEQKQFVLTLKNNIPHFFVNSKVLDVGSLNINGTLRDFFDNSEYTGIDIGPGPGVDIVCRGELYNAPDQTYDVVCSAECFEHNPAWAKTFRNMIRMSKQGSLIFFTCATTGRKEHGTSKEEADCNPLMTMRGQTFNYYKNLTRDDFTSIIDFSKVFSLYEFSTNEQSHDLYFWGIRSCKI